MMEKNMNGMKKQLAGMKYNEHRGFN